MGGNAHLGIAKWKDFVRHGIVAAVLLGMPLATPSEQGEPPAETGQSASSQKVDWALFLPAGEGKFQTSVFCSTCHSLQAIVAEQRSDEAGWSATVQTMVYTNGAAIQDNDMAAISKYLAHSFGPTTPKLELPIHINTAPKETVGLLGSLTPVDVQKILDARNKEKFRDFAALEAVIGNGKLTKYKLFIAFD